MADHPRPTPKERVREIEAYVPGKSGSGDCKATAHKLSANESPLGPSPIAVEALRVAASKIGTYPEGSATHLREAIADVHGLDPTRIVCSNGSDEMLSLLAKAYMTADGEGIVCKYGFALYKSFIRAAGGRPITVRESDEHTDIDAVLEAVTTATKMVYVANPNNPTGTYISSTEVCRLHAGLPKTTLLVLDAAYAEYVHRDDYDAGIALVASSENVVMTRTFSKAYGAAGLRVGWMYGPAHIVDTINKVRPPFNVGGMSIDAGIALVNDRDHLERAIAHNDRWLPWLSDELGRLGLRVTPSVCNFVLFHFPSGERPTAAEAYEYLAKRGFILRQVVEYRLPNALRLTVGSEEANRGVISSLAQLMTC